MRPQAQTQKARAKSAGFFVARERPMLWLNETKKHGEPLMTGARLKHYGWGREGEGMTGDERNFVLGRYHAKFGSKDFDTINVPRLEDLSLRAPRVTPRPRLLRNSAPPSATIALRTPTANPIRTMSRRCSAITPARPTWSPIPAMKPRYRP
jgi:hypothetical protein